MPRLRKLERNPSKVSSADGWCRQDGSHGGQSNSFVVFGDVHGLDVGQIPSPVGFIGDESQPHADNVQRDCVNQIQSRAPSQPRPCRPKSAPIRPPCADSRRRNNQSKKRKELKELGNIETVLRRTKMPKRSMIEVYLRKNGMDQELRVFAFDGPDEHIRQALLHRTPPCAENPVAGSVIWDFKWCVTDCESDYRNLREGNFYNHFQNNRILTTKSGIASSLRRLCVDEGVAIDRFFPRCYDLSRASEKDDFILDFRRSAALNIAKQHVRLSGCVGCCGRAGYRYNVDVLRIVARALELWISELVGSIQEERQKTDSIQAGQWDALVLYSELDDSQLCQGAPEFELSCKSRAQVFSASGNLLTSKDSNQQRPRPFDIRRWFEFSGHVWSTAVNFNLNDSITSSVSTIGHCWPQASLQGPRNVWIVKPGSSSKGCGVACTHSLPEVLHQCRVSQDRIVQKYLENPLLLFSGRKFDIRQWVLVTSFRPLQAYMFSTCYLRLCNRPYDLGDLEDRQRHVSNWSVNRNGQHVAEGGIASLAELRTALGEVTGDGNYWEKSLLPELRSMILHCLRAAETGIVQREGCFELYGFDFLIGEDLRPWLLEVNLSPACEARTPWLVAVLDRMAHRLTSLLLDGCLEDDGLSPDWIPIAAEEAQPHAGDGIADGAVNLMVVGKPVNVRTEKWFDVACRRKWAQRVLARAFQRFLRLKAAAFDVSKVATNGPPSDAPRSAPIDVFNNSSAVDASKEATNGPSSDAQHSAPIDVFNDASNDVSDETSYIASNGLCAFQLLLRGVIAAWSAHSADCKLAGPKVRAAWLTAGSCPWSSRPLKRKVVVPTSPATEIISDDSNPPQGDEYSSRSIPHSPAQCIQGTDECPARRSPAKPYGDEYVSQSIPCSPVLGAHPSRQPPAKSTGCVIAPVGTELSEVILGSPSIGEGITESILSTTAVHNCQPELSARKAGCELSVGRPPLATSIAAGHDGRPAGFSREVVSPFCAISPEVRDVHGFSFGFPAIPEENVAAFQLPTQQSDCADTGIFISSSIKAQAVASAEPPSSACPAGSICTSSNLAGIQYSPQACAEQIPTPASASSCGWKSPIKSRELGSSASAPEVKSLGPAMVDKSADAMGFRVKAQSDTFDVLFDAASAGTVPEVANVFGASEPTMEQPATCTDSLCGHPEVFDLDSSPTAVPSARVGEAISRIQRCWRKSRVSGRGPPLVFPHPESAGRKFLQVVVTKDSGLDASDSRCRGGNQETPSTSASSIKALSPPRAVTTLQRQPGGHTSSWPGIHPVDRQPTQSSAECVARGTASCCWASQEGNASNPSANLATDCILACKPKTSEVKTVGCRAVVRPQDDVTSVCMLEFVLVRPSDICGERRVKHSPQQAHNFPIADTHQRKRAEPCGVSTHQSRGSAIHAVRRLRSADGRPASGQCQRSSRNRTCYSEPQAAARSHMRPFRDCPIFYPQNQY